MFILTSGHVDFGCALGDDGVIDGQGSVWWDWFSSHSLNYSRPHLVEFEDSENVVVSNLTFLNLKAWGNFFFRKQTSSLEEIVNNLSFSVGATLGFDPDLAVFEIVVFGLPYYRHC